MKLNRKIALEIVNYLPRQLVWICLNYKLHRVAIFHLQLNLSGYLFWILWTFQLQCTYSAGLLSFLHRVSFTQCAWWKLLVGHRKNGFSCFSSSLNWSMFWLRNRHSGPHSCFMSATCWELVAQLYFAAIVYLCAWRRTGFSFRVVTACLRRWKRRFWLIVLSVCQAHLRLSWMLHQRQSPTDNIVVIVSLKVLQDRFHKASKCTFEWMSFMHSTISV